MEVLVSTDIDWLFSEEAFFIYAPCMYQPTYEAYKSQMKNYASDTAVRIFISEKDHRKAGILVLDRSKLIAEIVGIAVAEQNRCCGIGKNLIQEVMNLEHLDRIYAQTDEEAINFYRKCGFTEEKIIREYPEGAVVRYNCYLSN